MIVVVVVVVVVVELLVCFLCMFAISFIFSYILGYINKLGELIKWEDNDSAQLYQVPEMTKELLIFEIETYLFAIKLGTYDRKLAKYRELRLNLFRRMRIPKKSLAQDMDSDNSPTVPKPH